MSRDGDNPPQTSWTAAELLEVEFGEPRWAVPGLLAEGANLLCGPPKLGKSWMALNIAVAVATGTAAMGRIRVDQGDVLYLALEDTGRRLQSRLRMSLNGHKPPSRLTLETQCPPLDQGGRQYIIGWLQRHPDTRLVIVDVLARVRPVDVPTSNGRYDLDYKTMTMLKDIADEHGVCVLIVHHTRKTDAEDFLDRVSGTHGLAGSADAILVLERTRGEATAKLSITGRDVEEADYALKLDSSSGRWTMLEGPTEEHTVGDTRRLVLQTVRALGPCGPAEVTHELGASYETVKKTMQRMAKDGQLQVGPGDGQYHVE